jgi:hypothetical protein
MVGRIKIAHDGKIGDIEIEDGQSKTIPSIRMNDVRFIANKGKATNSAGKPNIHVEEKKVVITPAQLCLNTATIILNSEEYSRLLTTGAVVIPDEIEKESNEIPPSGQRKITRGRIKDIHSGWADSELTCEGYTESVSIYAYGCTLDSKGINIIPNNSILCLCDGGGRSGSHAANPEVAIGRKIQWLLKINLSGSKANMLAEFRKLNGDAKKLTKKDLLSAEVALLDEMPDYKPEANGFSEKLFATWLTRELYDNHRDEDSWLWLCNPNWREECDNDAKGKVTSLPTLLKDKNFIRLMESSNYTTSQLIKVLNFGFRQCYEMCPEAREDALKNSGKESKLHSSLALKVIAWLTLKLYRFVHGDPSKFEEVINSIVSGYYGVNKAGFRNSKLKKVSLDDLFMYSTYFADDRFNSGQKSTGDLIVNLHGATEAVLGKKIAGSKWDAAKV